VNPLSRAVGRARFELGALPVHRAPRRVTAMIRFKDEEEFLDPAIRSIADHVDELVLIDNLSRDRSPEIAEAIRADYPAKTRSLTYPHQISKAGQENWELARSPEGATSPHLLANFFAWCVQQCSEPFVLKWDADMIATEAFHRGLADWRRSRCMTVFVRGANVHPDRIHLLGAKTTDVEHSGDGHPEGVPEWVRTMSHTANECRVFPRLRARYETREEQWWSEYLATPYLRSPYARRYRYQVQDVAFLHLKFCKRDPHFNHSAEFAEMMQANTAVGPPLPDEWRDLLAATIGQPA
jgi:hypothetical protein